MDKVPSPWWYLSFENHLLCSGFADERQETFSAPHTYRLKFFCFVGFAECIIGLLNTPKRRR
jgi:hypothetical protein